MKRKIYQDILKWSKNKARKPLIITGKRQIGKTYIVKKFAEDHFKKFVYLNFIDNPEYSSIFEESLNPIDIYRQISLLYQVSIDDETLVILDEFQESPNVFNFLKTLNESDWSNNLIATGSWIEAAVFKSKISTPVGQVKIMKMYPMTINEFIVAVESEDMESEIMKAFREKRRLPDLLHKKLTNLYIDYLTIGGLPEIVSIYKNNPDDYRKVIKDNLPSSLPIILGGELTPTYKEINEKLSYLNSGYINDLVKYGSNTNMIKMLALYDSLAINLNRPYNKFKYSLVKTGTQKRNWIKDIDFLSMARISIPTYMVKEPIIPLNGNYDVDHFKLYFSDMGLLANKTQLSPITMIKTPFSYMGWISENFVAIHLQTFTDKLFYWYKQPYEVDFLIESVNGIVPIEVKTSRAKKGKSFTKYIEKYKPKISITISKDNFKYGKTINIPFYAIFVLNNYQ